MKDDAPPPVTVIDCDMMKHFAIEAEVSALIPILIRVV